MRLRRTLLAGVACLGVAGGSAAEELDVDLELVLAVDVSRSMDPSEQRLQKEGYLAALKHPEVLDAIRSGFLGRIAVTYAEWAGPGSRKVIAPWTLIDSLESASAFTATIASQPITYLHGTSISGALLFSSGLFEGNGFRSERQVIDVSGDGPNNMGYPVLQVRESVLNRGITINGLPIMLRRQSGYGMWGMAFEHLDTYYEDCVIGGPGAFLVTVASMDRIAEAIRRKLVLEIAGAEPKIVPVAETFAGRAPRVDCLIGEKLRRRWMDP